MWYAQGSTLLAKKPGGICAGAPTYHQIHGQEWIHVHSIQLGHQQEV